MDLPAMDRTTTGGFFEGCDQRLLAFSTMKFQSDVLLLKLGSDFLQDPGICVCTKGDTGQAFDPAAMIRQQSIEL